MGQFETKHTAFNLSFKKHPVFTDNLIVEDSSEEVFLWIDKDTGKVSFGGKYFQIYNEQKLVQAMKNFAYIANEFVENVENGKQQDPDLYKQLKEALEFAETIKVWKKLSDKQPPYKLFKVNDDYPERIIAKTAEEALNDHNERGGEGYAVGMDEVEEMSLDTEGLFEQDYGPPKLMTFREYIAEVYGADFAPEEPVLISWNN